MLQFIIQCYLCIWINLFLENGRIWFSVLSNTHVCLILSANSTSICYNFHWLPSFKTRLLRPYYRKIVNIFCSLYTYIYIYIYIYIHTLVKGVDLYFRCSLYDSLLSHRLSWFSSVPSGKCWDSTLNSETTASSHIVYDSPYRSKLYTHCGNHSTATKPV